MTNGGWIDCFILNPNGGYVRNNGYGSFHSNYSVIFNLGTTLRDSNYEWKPTVDNWNKSPNMSTYSNGGVTKVVYTTVSISGSSCNDTLGDIESYIPFTKPSLETSINSFKYWNFNTVDINGGTFDLNKGDLEFIVSYYNQIESSEDNPFQKYETSTKIKLDKNSLFVNINEQNGQAFFTASIPRSELLKNVNIRNGAFIDIGLHGSYWASNLPNGEITCDIVESGISLVLDSKYEEDLQKEKESQQRQELIDNQKETNNKLDETNEKLEETNNNIKDTNDFLKNDNVPEDNEFNLPSVEVDDPTANFFDTMFMGLYNAINVEGNQQISFKIFSKDIVINSDDFNFLVGNEWGILRIILTSSWVFGIGIFILKDIRKMIDKIKSGNIESVASDDIKADMV